MGKYEWKADAGCCWEGRRPLINLAANAKLTRFLRFNKNKFQFMPVFTKLDTNV